MCVSGQVRQQVREDNLAASSRTNPARLLYGPNTCKEGYVWREADEKDWLCVSPQVRERLKLPPWLTFRLPYERKDQAMLTPTEQQRFMTVHGCCGRVLQRCRQGAGASLNQSDQHSLRSRATARDETGGREKSCLPTSKWIGLRAWHRPAQHS